MAAWQDYLCSAYQTLSPRTDKTFKTETQFKGWFCTQCGAARNKGENESKQTNTHTHTHTHIHTHTHTHNACAVDAVSKGQAKSSGIRLAVYLSKRLQAKDIHIDQELLFQTCGRLNKCGSLPSGGVDDREGKREVEREKMLGGVLVASCICAVLHV